MLTSSEVLSQFQTTLPLYFVTRRLQLTGVGNSDWDEKENETFTVAFYYFEAKEWFLRIPPCTAY